MNKRDCLERAKQLISDSRPESLRYAALELRCCIEAITYEKLKSSSSRIPQSVLNKWQPPQAIKALSEFEPNTDKGFTMAFGIEDEPGKRSNNMQFFGEHKTFKGKWLNKHYHKLGNLIHFPSIEQQKAKKIKSNEEIQKYLQEVLSHIEDILKGNILGGWIGQTYTFKCLRCNEPVIVTKYKVEKANDIECLNPHCKAEYHAELNDKSQTEFYLKATKFDCIECGNKIEIENRKIKIGMQFRCDSCGTLHEMFQRQWGYGKVESQQITFTPPNDKEATD